jgi:putative aldouronate transport system substrate-binding protein
MNAMKQKTHHAKPLARLLALALSAALAAAILGACQSGAPAASDAGSGGAGSGSAAATSQTSAAAAEPSTQPSGGGGVSISVYGPSNMEEFPSGDDENNNRIINYIRETTGYDVQWTIAPNDNARQALNMLMASGSPPDMIYTGDKAVFADYTTQKLIKPVNEFIAGTKNISSIVPEETWRAVENGGQYYAVPVPQNQFASSGVIARTDYLERLGNPKLETIDDFVGAFEAALSQKIGGADTIPYVMYGTIVDMFGYAYGLGVEYDDLGDGKLQSTWIGDSARAYLEFMADLFARKLIDQEYAVNTTATIAQEKMSNGQGLMYTGSWTDMNVLERTITDGDKAFGVIAPPAGIDGNPTYFNMNPPVRVYFLFPVESQKTQDAISFLDRCIEDDIRLVISYGWEGEHYNREIQDGNEVIVQTDEAENIRYRIYYNMWDTVEDFHNRVNLKGFASGYYPMREFTKKTNLMNYAPPVNAVTEFSSALKDLKDEYFMKIITGAWGIDKFDEFVGKWRASGGDQVLEEINQWYVTFK